ncbi:MAG: hypothetical protein VKJ46_16950 [Leptolyngbyaceae bacterium]|nr:hypothetical protein [Leptolyngbyaceae bacterium]
MADPLYTLLFSLLLVTLGLGLLPLPSQAQPKKSPNLLEDIKINPQFSNPILLRGLSGGTTPAQNVAGRAETTTGPCVGFVNDKPDHTLVLPEFFKYLSLQVQSPEDTTLVVRGPGGSWCNDDNQGKNPGLVGQWLAGSYQIWVGTYNKTKFHPYQLRITKGR